MITVDKIFKSIKSTYTTNKTAFQKYYSQRVNADEQIKEACKGTRQTENYYRDLKSNLEEVRQACNTKLEEITNSTRETLASVLSVAQKEFRSFNSKEIDTATLELLKTDILSIDELLELATDFETNRTMTRVIGKAIARKATDTTSGELKQKILLMTASDNAIIEAVKSVIDMTINALGGYKPLNKTNTAYNRQENDGADLAIILQEDYFNSIEPIIKNALAVEVMNNYKGAKSEEILNKIETNAFYQQIRQEQQKEINAISEAKRKAEESRQETADTETIFISSNANNATA